MRGRLACPSLLVKLMGKLWLVILVGLLGLFFGGWWWQRAGRERFFPPEPTFEMSADIDVELSEIEAMMNEANEPDEEFDFSF